MGPDLSHPASPGSAGRHAECPERNGPSRRRQCMHDRPGVHRSDAQHRADPPLWNRRPHPGHGDRVLHPGGPCVLSLLLPRGRAPMEKNILPVSSHSAAQPDSRSSGFCDSPDSPADHMVCSGRSVRGNSAACRRSQLPGVLRKTGKTGPSPGGGYPGVYTLSRMGTRLITG